MKLILFGASAAGQKAFEQLKSQYKIINFVDNDEKKVGTYFCGLKVISPNSLKKINLNETGIIITSHYDIEIAKQLIEELNIKRFGSFYPKKNKIFYFNYENLKQKVNIKENKISLFSFTRSGSNTFALYNNIPKEIKEKYEIAFLETSNKKNDYYLDILESKMGVYTWTPYFDENKINLQLFHGFPLKTLSKMAKYSDIAKKNNTDQWNKLNAIASYSDTYSTMMNAAYGVDGSLYHVTGMPRNDYLFSSKGKELLEKVLNLRFGNKKVILYMPTFRESLFGETNGDDEKFTIFDMDDFNSSQFNKFLEENNILLIIKMHPYNTRNVLFDNCTNIIKLEESDFNKFDIDMYQLINGIDILITDYSSIYFDFLLLNKPIIFTPLDLEEYRETRGFFVEPYDFWAPGPKCYTVKDLKDEILNAITSPEIYENQRNQVCSIVHRYRDGESGVRVWNLIDNLMQQTE